MNRTGIFFRTKGLLIFGIIFGVFICPGLSAHLFFSFAGDLYRWVDEKGVVHFSDTAPGPSSVRKQDMIHFSETTDDPKKSRDLPSRTGSKQITIYTLDT